MLYEIEPDGPFLYKLGPWKIGILLEELLSTPPNTSAHPHCVHGVGQGTPRQQYSHVSLPCLHNDRHRLLLSLLCQS